MAAGPRRRFRLNVFLICLLAVLAGGWLSRAWWLEPWLARTLADQLSHRLGTPVTITSLNGSWWSGASLEGLDATGLTLGPLQRIHLGRARATWHPSLFTGRLDALYGLDCEGALVVLDLRRDTDSTPGAAWTSLLEQLPQNLPNLRISGTLVIRLRQGDIVIAGMALHHYDGDIALAYDSAQIPWVDVSFSGTAQLRREGGQIDVVHSSGIHGLQLQSGHLRLSDAVQSLDLTATLGAGHAQFHAEPGNWRIKVDHIDAAAVLPLVRGLPPQARHLHGRVSGHLARGEAMPFSLSVDDLRYKDWDLRLFSASGHFSGKDATITRASAESGDGLTLSGRSIQMVDGRVVRGQGELNATDLSPTLRRFWPEACAHLEALTLSAQITLDESVLLAKDIVCQGTGLTLRGRGQLAIDTSDLSLAASITADVADIAQQFAISTELAAHLTIDGTWSGSLTSPLLAKCQAIGTATQVRVGNTALADITAQLQADRGLADVQAVGSGPLFAWATHLRLARTMDAWLLDIPALTLAHDHHTISAAETAHIAKHDGRWSLRPLRGIASFGQFRCGGSYDGVNIDLALHLAAIDLAAARDFMAGDVPITGLADADLTLRGPITAPHITLHIASPVVTIGRHRGTLALKLHQDDDGCHIARGNIDVHPYGRIEVGGSWPIRFGSTGITRLHTTTHEGYLRSEIASLDALLPAHFTSGTLHLSGEIRPDDQGQPYLTANARLADALLKVADPLIGDRIAAVPSLGLQAVLSGTIDDLSLQFLAALNGRTACSGTCVSTVAKRNPLNAEAWPLSGTATIGLNLGDLAGLSSEIVRLSGALDGRASLSGTIATPQMAASLTVTNGEVKLRNDVPSIARINGDITVANNLITISSLQGEMGYAPVNVTDGRIMLGGDDEMHLDLTVVARNALLVQNRDLRLRANTDDLRLHGPLRRLTASGTIDIANALYSRPVDYFSRGGTKTSVGDGRIELFSLRNPPLSSMRFDLHFITSKADVNSGLRIANNLAQAICSVDLHLGGTGHTPEPFGRISTIDATVALPFSTFIVERASLIFPEDEPFRPNLNVVGWSQVRQWRVTVNSAGPIDDINIEASAVGLSNEDAVLLLTTGSTRQELEDPDGQKAMLSRVGTFVGKELFRSIRGPGDPDAEDSLLSILDRWTLEFGREISKDGLETIDAEIRVVPYHIEPGVYIYGQRDRYEDYNIGITLRLRFGNQAP